MPAKKQTRTQRVRRQAVRSAQRPPQSYPGAVSEEAEVESASVSSRQPARQSRTSLASVANRRSRIARAPAQIVIANYDFLRHDLRLLALLAPSLVAIMIVLSFFVH